MAAPPVAQAPHILVPLAPLDDAEVQRLSITIKALQQNLFDWLRPLSIGSVDLTEERTPLELTWGFVQAEQAQARYQEAIRILESIPQDLQRLANQACKAHVLFLHQQIDVLNDQVTNLYVLKDPLDLRGRREEIRQLLERLETFQIQIHSSQALQLEPEIAEEARRIFNRLETLHQQDFSDSLEVRFSKVLYTLTLKEPIEEAVQRCIWEIFPTIAKELQAWEECPQEHSVKTPKVEEELLIVRILKAQRQSSFSFKRIPDDLYEQAENIIQQIANTIADEINIPVSITNLWQIDAFKLARRKPPQKHRLPRFYNPSDQPPTRPLIKVSLADKLSIIPLLHLVVGPATVLANSVKLIFCIAKLCANIFRLFVTYYLLSGVGFSTSVRYFKKNKEQASQKIHFIFIGLLRTTWIGAIGRVLYLKLGS